MNLKGLCEELKSVLSLVDVMDYCGLEIVSRTGEAWKAKCWNHEDQIASLNISPKKGLYHCFSTGCGASGDIISFWSQWHNVEAGQAAKQLAEEFGLDASPYLDSSPEEKRLNRYRVITTSLVRAFHERLLKNPGALAYVKKRGVSVEALSTFQIGYCPSIEEASKAGAKAGATGAEIKALGLFTKSQFGNTILFPLYHRGAAVYFYSKVLSGGNKEGPKYFGPHGSHPLSQKGAMFGLQVARRESRVNGGIVLVEGFFDVLTLYSRGFKNVVGMLGSSPREEQMEQIAAIHIPKVTVLFDADKAGDAGVKKAIESRKGDVLLKVAFCPEGDPDEYVLRYGADGLRGVLDQSIGASDYLMGSMTDRLMGGDLGERSQTITDLVRLSTKLPGHEAALMIKQISEDTGIPINDIMDASVIEEDEKKVVQHEVQVLGACLKDEVCLLDAIAKFRGRDVWLLSRHRTIWNAMISLRKKGVCEYTGELIREAANGVHLNGSLDVLFERPISNFEYSLGSVYDSFTRRALRRAGKRLSSMALDEAKAVPSILTEHLSGLSKDVTPDSSIEFTAAQQVESAMDYVHERMASEEKIPGIDLGPEWGQFTQAILGLQRGHMNIISALPKTGKTTLGLNWCKAVAIEQGQPCLWLNFEMKQRDLSLRFLSMMSGISNSRLRTGAIGEEEKRRLDECAQQYYAAPLYVVDAASLSIHEVVNMMRKYVYDHGVKAIFLDYIQLIRQSESKLQYWEHHQRVSTELKNAISLLDVPLVAISQLSKGALEGGGAAHQGGSFKYLQDCDLAMELRRCSKEELAADPRSNLMLNIEFSRHGQQEIFVKLLFDQQSLKISEA